MSNPLTTIYYDIPAGQTLENAYNEMKRLAEESNKRVEAEFNTYSINSDMSIDDVFLLITDKTYIQWLDYRQKQREEEKRKEEEFQNKLPELIEKYKQEARGLVIDSQLDYWDKIVPIRLNDLYQGMELGETLKYCKMMRDESMPLEDRLVKARQDFINSVHSGMSRSLMLKMIHTFVPDGDTLRPFIIQHDK
jgi:hypothetical protein